MTGSYATWAKEWSDQGAEKFKLMSKDFFHRHGGDLLRTQSYDHALFSDPRLTFTHHGAFLEDFFPGSTVTWDAHPELRCWPNYALSVVRMVPGEWMWSRYKHQYEIPSGRGQSTYRVQAPVYRMRRLAKNGDFRDVVRAGVDRGFHELVAHQLVPNPNGNGTLAKRQPYAEHKIAVEYDHHHRNDYWTSARGGHPSTSVNKRHTVRSVYALYSVQAERWCVVR